MTMTGDSCHCILLTKSVDYFLHDADTHRFLVVWYILSRIEIRSLARLKERLFPKGCRAPSLVKPLLHTLAAIVLLACTSMELFFFFFFFFFEELRFIIYTIMNVNNWGFGRLVGITVWFTVIVDLARREIAMSLPWVPHPFQPHC